MNNQIPARAFEVDVGMTPVLSQVVHELMLDQSLVVKPLLLNDDRVGGFPITGIDVFADLDRASGPAEVEGVVVTRESGTDFDLTVPRPVNIGRIQPQGSVIRGHWVTAGGKRKKRQNKQ